MIKKERTELENSEVNRKNRPSRLLKLLVFFLGTIVAVSCVLGAVLYFVGIPGVMTRLKAEPPPVYVTKELGEQLVNLADESGGRYLRLNVVMELEDDKKLLAEIDEKKAKLVDGVLRVLRSKRVSDVWSVEQEDVLKKEILNAINKELEEGKVKRVLFTDFLIQ